MCRGWDRPRPARGRCDARRHTGSLPARSSWASMAFQPSIPTRRGARLPRNSGGPERVGSSMSVQTTELGLDGPVGGHLATPRDGNRR
ncbi:MAG: hypothetical protein QOE32_368 [Pseudonocardiales bacterium]|nr:hypothetical protein [Pseudonocardiales bacterium]